jgi:hypothetical protein
VTAAQLDNLCKEDRVAEIDITRTAVGDAFASVGTGDLDAARAAIAASQRPFWDPSCSLLGLIPTISSKHTGFQAVSFLTGTQIERHIISSFRGRAPLMPARVSLPDPLYARYPRRFMWATFSEDVATLSPRDIAIGLGLPHFLPGETVYRVSLGSWPNDVYIPTCMDSGLFEAWMRPPPTHAEPWGLTRHLLTGASDKAELLVQVADVEGRGLVAERIGGPGDVISSYTPDLIIARDLAAYAA